MSFLRWTAPALCIVLSGANLAFGQQRSWIQRAPSPQPPAWSKTSTMPPLPTSPATPTPGMTPNYSAAAAATPTPAAPATRYYPLPARTPPQPTIAPTASAPPSNIVPTAAYGTPSQGARAPLYTAQYDPSFPAYSSAPGYGGPSFNGPTMSGPTTVPPVDPMMPGGSMPGGYPPGAMMGPPMGPMMPQAGMPYAGPAMGGPMPTPDPVSSGIAPNFDPFAPGANSAMAPSTCDPNMAYPYDPGVRSCGPWFASVSGLIMTRTRPNNVELASMSGDPQIGVLNSERTVQKWTGGFETRLGRAIGQRWAVEGVYWALAPLNSQTLVHSDNNDINSRLDFQDLSYEGTPLTSEFANSREQRLTRHNSFQNMELNVLQQAMAVGPNGRFGMMYFMGARYFRFNETLLYEAAASNALLSDNNPETQTDYYIREDNNLVGGQFGGRGTLNLGNRLRLFAMPRFGVFNDRIIQQQRICMVVNDRNVKNSVALLGQLDAGMSYQFLPCCSMYLSYRAMALSGIATGDDNVARSFVAQPAMHSINSSSSLILHGAQAGFQWQF